MGNLLPAIRQTAALLADVPLLVPAVAAVFVASSIVSTILQIVPLVGFVLVLGYAIVGRAAVSAITLSLVSGAARRGTLGFDDGADAVVDDTLPLAGAYAVVAGAGLAAVIGGVLVFALVAGVGAGVAPSPAGDPTGAAGLLGVVAVAVLALVAVGVGVVVQFLDVAVVLGGASALGSFRTAWAAVRQAPLSVAGYTAVRVAILTVPTALVVGGGLALVVGPGVLAAAAGAGTDAGASYPSTLGAALAGSLVAFVALLALVFLVVAPLTRAVSTAFHAVFFARLRREYDLPPSDADGGARRSQSDDASTATPASTPDAGTDADPGPARLD